MDMSEELNVSWPPPVPSELQDNPWLHVAPQRGQEVVCYAALEEGTKWVDHHKECRGQETARTPVHQRSFLGVTFGALMKVDS